MTTPQGLLANAGLICSNCKTPLDLTSTRLACPQCAHVWPISDGVARFTADAPYWGELSERHIRDLLARMETRHWREAFFQSPDPDFERVYSFVANLNRANWQYLLPVQPDARALDIGAGMGTISHALARRYRTVYALEQVPLRIEFMRRRFDQDGINNVLLVQGTFNQMPFPDTFFDLVALNGVLEWLPLGDPARRPDEVQAGAVAKAFALLRPEGYLYVGIENRLAPGYFIGYKDPHCGLPFVTILPRFLAHWVAKRQTGKPYSNYLYSSRGYRRLLSRAGFQDVEIFAASPSYNNPAHMVPIRSPAYRFFYDQMFPKSGHPLKRALQTIAARTGVLAHLEFAFLIMGRKPG